MIQYTSIRDDLTSYFTVDFSPAYSSGYLGKVSEMPQSFRNYLIPMYNDLKDSFEIPKYASKYYFEPEESTSLPRYYSIFQTSPVFPRLAQISFFVQKTNNILSYYQDKNHFSYDNVSFDSPYPIAVRYTNGTNLWAIERPPFVADITYRPTSSSSSSSRYQTYRINIPWTVMVLDVNPRSSYYSASLFLNDGPLSSLDDYLVPCLFPNMYTDARMCLNQTSVGLQQYLAEINKFDIGSIYNYILNDYMSGGWNADLGAQNYEYFYNSFSDQQPNLARLKETIHGGDRAKKIKPLSFRRRAARSAVTSNLLKALSHLSLDEMLAVVREAKLNNSVIRNFQFSQMMNRQESSSSLVDQIGKTVNYSNYLNAHSRLLFSPYFLSHMNEGVVSKFSKDMHAFLLGEYEEHMELLLSSTNYCESFNLNFTPTYFVSHSGEIISLNFDTDVPSSVFAEPCYV